MTDISSSPDPGRPNPPAGIPPSEKLPPEFVEQMRQLNLEEILAEVREMEEKGGLELQDFLPEIEQGLFTDGPAGLLIRHAVAECYLGWVLVAASERGVCMIVLGNTAEELRAAVAARFPKAELVDGDADFAGWVAQVVALLEAPGTGLELPLDIQGTAFQRRVWEALRAIPAGATASYAEIARRIGRPSAVRAVARACADNPLAVAIPCHRAVGKDGDLRGYRWGIERKRALLKREGEVGPV